MPVYIPPGFSSVTPYFFVLCRMRALPLPMRRGHPAHFGNSMSTIAELMTPHPITVRPDDSVQYAARLMDDLNVGALPVCDDDLHLLGIVTDRDITVRAIAAGLHPTITTVDLVMTDHVRSCSPRQSAAEALAQMASVQIRRLPVLDDEDRLVGIIALGDLAAREPSAGVEDALRRISTPAAPDRVLAVV